MWNYERRLEYPVNISRCNPQAAMIIMSQYGGPDGEMGASMRYLAQRYSMKDRKVAGVLTDIGVSVGKLHMKIVPENREGIQYYNLILSHLIFFILINHFQQYICT